jgi:hypothetical protein
LTKCYEKLNGVEHELLTLEFKDFEARFADNPFLTMFQIEHDEIVLPTDAPPLGLVEEPIEPEPYKIAVGA